MPPLIATLPAAVKVAAGLVDQRVPAILRRQPPQKLHQQPGRQLRILGRRDLRAQLGQLLFLQRLGLRLVVRSRRSSSSRSRSA